MNKRENFSKECLQEAENIQYIEASRSGRREVQGYTIDGETSKDLDDGFMLFYQNNIYTLQISIADVSEYVKPSMAIFEEAYHRIETKYFKFHNSPMLPYSISENMLSLLEGRKTPTITIEISFDEALNITSLDFYKSLFYNKKQFSYPQINQIIKKKDTTFPVITLAYKFAQLLLQERIRNNELAIYYKLQKQLYTDEEGNIKKLEDERSSEGNIIVQELMISTNKALSEFMARKNVPILYRNHTARDNTPERLELMEILKAAGANNQLMSQLAGRTSLWFDNAEYSPILKGHYGLNAPSYMHFTSPIRRFADLVNHYQLSSYLSKGTFLNKDYLLEVSDYINTKKIEWELQRKKIFKTKAYKNIYNSMLNGTLEELLELNSSDFKIAMKLEFKNENPSEIIFEAIEHKLKNKELLVNHLYSLFFKAKANEQAWESITEQAFDYIENNIGFADQILRQSVQKYPSFRSMEVEIEPIKSEFAARVIGLIDNEIKSTSYYFLAHSKQEAKNRAAVHFLMDYKNGLLVSDPQTKMPEITTEAIIESRPEENHLLEINNLHLRNKQWSKPQYQIDLVGGTSNAPIFLCTFTIEYQDNTYIYQAESSSKKDAKILASNKFFTEQNENITTINTDEKITTEKSPFEIINNLFQKHKLKKPQIIFYKVNDEFSCTLKAIIKEQEYQAEAVAANKKAAKKAASQKLLMLFETENLFNQSQE